MNPFGVQSDGALVETGSTSGNGFNNAVVRREIADLEPRLRVRLEGPAHRATATRSRSGFPSRASASSRRRSSAGASTSPARCSTRAREDSLGAGQAGQRLVPGAVRATWSGLTELRRGLVLDSIRRSPRGPPARRDGSGWDYVGRQSGAGRQRPLGRHQQPDPQRHRQSRLLARSSRTRDSSSSIRGTSCSSQEKRPFFLDGIEQFTTPNNADLHPADRAAGRGGQAHRQGVRHRHRAALRGGRPGRLAHRHDHPIYNLLRLQRDVGAQSRLGVVYTDRIVGSNYNRVAGRRRPTRVRRDLQPAAAGSPAAGPGPRGVTTTAPLWQARFVRNGRTFGSGPSSTPATQTSAPQSGFFPRPGLVHAQLPIRG